MKYYYELKNQSHKFLNELIANDALEAGIMLLDQFEKNNLAYLAEETGFVIFDSLPPNRLDEITQSEP